ncbi:MAG: VanZ family protein [Planctomycetota bacterium]|jgi:hypothetical protein
MVSRKLGLTVLTLVTIVTLLFGLWPLNFFPENRVRWLAGQDGIQFYKPPGSSRRAHGGVVYSDAPLEVRAGSQAFEPTTIEIYLESHGGKPGGLAHILSFHDGRRLSPLVIGLWESYLNIRSRDNRNAARNTYRDIGLKNGLIPNDKKLIAIASGPERTEIYVNGELARSFNIPSLIGVDHFSGYLSLGNSSIGHNAWAGNLYGLALYDTLLTPEQIRQHHALWTDRPANVPATVEPEPVALYTFTERTGASVHDQMPNKNHLTIPPAFKALKRYVVLQFWRNMRWTRGVAVDVIVNIAGFVPFALCMLVVIAGSKGMSHSRAAFLTVLAGAILSLIIEASQLTLPTRTPSSLDLLCNTAGAALGVLVFRIVTCVKPTSRIY